MLTSKKENSETIIPKLIEYSTQNMNLVIFHKFLILLNKHIHAYGSMVIDMISHKVQYKKVNN